MTQSTNSSDLLYHRLFSDSANETSDWNALNSPLCDFYGLPCRSPDFTIAKPSPNTYQGKGFLNAIVRKSILLALYPAQSTLFTIATRSFKPQAHLDSVRRDLAKRLNDSGFIARHVLLQKNCIQYSGVLIGKPDQLGNGKWALQALGNSEFWEFSAEEIAHLFTSCGYNTLIVNGPSVGRSEGHPSPENIGNSQEVGICFLESKIRAKEIVISGRSFGGAAVGQAVLRHDFLPSIRYTISRQMTFDISSRICGEMASSYTTKLLGGFVEKLVEWTGLEMDSIAASKKLAELSIPEVIIQSTHSAIHGSIPLLTDFHSDGMIFSHTSLGYALVKEGITCDKFFIGIEKADHISPRAMTVLRDFLVNLQISSSQTNFLDLD